MHHKYNCINNRIDNRIDNRADNRADNRVDNSADNSGNNIFRNCNVSELRILDENFKILKDNRIDSDIYGYIIKVKDNILLKIVDKTIEKKKKRIDEKIMKSTIITGKVCETYGKPNLNRITEYLQIDTSEKKFNREKLCKYIELKLREYEDIKKNNLKWFYNLEESLEKIK